MATILRTWSYQYPWLYAAISQLAALGVGGESHFHHLPLAGLSLTPETKILDLCCGGGQATRFLVQNSQQVTGLDASPVALKRAAAIAPNVNYVQAMAEEMPFSDGEFDLVHTSVALHEMTSKQLQQILQEVYRVLKPNGVFTLIDLHQPRNLLFWPPLALFLWLFETETAWQLIKMDLVDQLTAIGFRDCQQRLHAGGSLQVIQATK
ncbi:MAG: class I SAM-dependent methyltransferase [Snowella sp.]|nr:class I SAM-dependent methyltransferase [Snowella sp.]